MKATLSAACRVSGCEGLFHFDGICTAELASLTLGTGDLSAELVSDPGEPDYLEVAAFTLEPTTDAFRTKLTDPGSALALATRFRRFATVIELAACRLAPLADADALVTIARTVIDNATGGTA